MLKMLVLNGPNLNLVGIREPGVYGKQSIDLINKGLQDYANELGVEIEIRQSNHEGQLIDWLHEAREAFDGVVLNAGAYTHYSYAIRDAISAIGKPVVEVHLSNVHARDEFRHTSVISPVCIGVICGFGRNSYHPALKSLVDLLK